MTKRETASLDRKVLAFVKSRGTTNVNQAARHLGIKWETANKSFKRLQAKAVIFYHQDMKLWSVWDDHNLQRGFDASQQSEKWNSDVELTTSTLVSPDPRSTLVRGQVGERVEKEGFVCHPKTRGSDVSRLFIRSHLDGQYLVEINTTGKMPETFVLPDQETTGGWIVRKMSGNNCYFGHINFSDDPKTFKFHSMANKDGRLSKLSVYVHPRYIYYKDNNFFAPIEFRQQVRDILSVLEGYGWRFGAVYQKGKYHMAINDPILASHVPQQHIENDDDAIRFDSSVKDGDGVCTEAEIYDDHQSAMAEMELMVELPQRFFGLDNKVTSMNVRIIDVERGLATITGILEKNVENTDHIISSISDLSKLTEFNTSILLGNAPEPEPQSYIAKNKEDAMYG